MSNDIVSAPEWWTSEMEEQWEQWVTTRPPVVQELARRFPPYLEFVMGENSMDYYVPYSYAEDGTLTVTRISGGLFAPEGEVLYRVFGVAPESLLLRKKTTQ